MLWDTVERSFKVIQGPGGGGGYIEHTLGFGIPWSGTGAGGGGGGGVHRAYSGLWNIVEWSFN